MTTDNAFPSKQGDSTRMNKQRLSSEQRDRVLLLRRRHSLREVATLTGLPLGTVKTLVSRCGAFRDNAQHRALFMLPPTQESDKTLPAVPKLPLQQAVTGDKEVDAVLWLHSVINTGQAELISKALVAAKRVKTPLNVLEKRYRDHLTATNPGNLFAALSSFGFSDLDGLAAKAIERNRRQAEGVARFGDSLFDDTPAENFCIEALRGVEPGEFGFLDKEEVAARFRAYPELMPHTLADCLHELDYWQRLFLLRNAVDSYGSDGAPETSAREWFVFGLMAEIRPRSKEEARAVFRYLIDSDRRDQAETNAILGNLIG
ncbi:hypothetical protein FQZ97_760980 [compost metagenome]